ncbi:hypothetical protein G6O69_12505 [Pseudenhygromyxa sp. WMMC2535]|uniref:hypothetical protein n=1 Tax=Pseudenhygromyxa sp. WMMC2535 TaxID=2712867 RepID=UPI0015563D72|nr:hypothetical protein [Pseudenhygromyxa sp. WMMC2535]NVB38654.1 hypothetical protein [Pseudenhygromyxa sp. WMMC2535]
MVDPETRGRLRALYQALQDRPLSPDDSAYVELFETRALSADDPVERMALSIEFAALETAQLFSGHRGTGKTTQLRRLRERLQRDPKYKVVICDMEDYLPMTDEVDVVDFLLAAAGALSDALSTSELLAYDPVNNYWARFTGWLRSQKIEVSELGITAKAKAGAPDGSLGAEAGLGVKLNLKDDPEFRKRIRERMKLRVGAFRAEVHSFVQDCLLRLRERHGQDTELVVVYDSIEHLRGTTTNAEQVAASVERLFRGHVEALRFPAVHTVFTVPPWLRLQYAGVGDRFDDYCQIPCVKVRARDDADASNTVGLDVLWKVASKRGDMSWLLGERAAFDELARASGGYLRDLFRLLSFVVRQAAGTDTPVSDEVRALAIADLRGGLRGFTNQEAVWLQQIEHTGTFDVDEPGHHFKLARFLDSHVLLAYRNGEDWYGVHPVIRADVERRARAWHESRASAKLD